MKNILDESNNYEELRDFHNTLFSICEIEKRVKQLRKKYKAKLEKISEKHELKKKES